MTEHSHKGEGRPARRLTASIQATAWRSNPAASAPVSPRPPPRATCHRSPSVQQLRYDGKPVATLANKGSDAGALAWFAHDVSVLKDGGNHGRIYSASLRDVALLGENSPGTRAEATCLAIRADFAGDPRPELMPMTGGYRRTPVLQIGADIYCDTQLILRVLK